MRVLRVLLLFLPIVLACAPRAHRFDVFVSDPQSASYFHIARRLLDREGGNLVVFDSSPDTTQEPYGLTLARNLKLANAAERERLLADAWDQGAFQSYGWIEPLFHLGLERAVCVGQFETAAAMEEYKKTAFERLHAGSAEYGYTGYPDFGKRLLVRHAPLAGPPTGRVFFAIDVAAFHVSDKNEILTDEQSSERMAQAFRLLSAAKGLELVTIAVSTPRFDPTSRPAASPPPPGIAAEGEKERMWRLLEETLERIVADPRCGRVVLEPLLRQPLDASIEKTSQEERGVSAPRFDLAPLRPRVKKLIDAGRITVSDSPRPDGTKGQK